MFKIKSSRGWEILFSECQVPCTLLNKSDIDAKVYVKVY